MNWHPTQPDGLHEQPCSVYNREGLLYDRGCAQKFCVKCLVTKNRRFYLRGIPPAFGRPWKTADKLYVLDDENRHNDVLRFRGLTTGAILTIILKKTEKMMILSYSANDLNFTTFGSGDWGNLSLFTRQFVTESGSFNPNLTVTAKFTQVKL